MSLCPSSWVVIGLVSIGAVFSVPVLAKGFSRRGKGVFYEANFLLQRAPQLVSLANIAVIAFSTFFLNGWFKSLSGLVPFISLSAQAPEGILVGISWLGVAILISGLIFMIGGWYSLGESFSTDAELLDGQKLRDGGLLRFVMHPAYSGIIQSLVGASVAAVSPLSLAIAVCAVAPLWLARAKYEEELLIKTFGESYKNYAARLKWRRLVPKFIPLGV
jgi:protein-S-isoprenylcysteine O-methyltransferase Ste14